MTRRLLLLLAALLPMAMAPLARAQSTYAADSSAAAAAAYPWVDISGTGNALTLNDDSVSSPIALGFTFSYGNTAYSQVRVSSNGLLLFGGTTTAGTNSLLPLTGASGEPNIDAVMAPLWDNLNPANVSSYLRYATQGSAPNRVFVVSWLAVPYWCANDNPTACNPAKNQTKNAFATFQVQIHEQGQFVFRYQSVNGAGGAHTGGATFGNPAGASIGYELGDADQVQYAFRSASVPSGTTILWTRRLSAPGRFNAFETSTAAAAISGVVKTKTAGTPFTLAIVALNTARTAVQTTFTGAVKVELMDAADNAGAVDASSGCRSSWTVMPGSAVQTLTFAGADAGRKNLTFSEANAWRDVRVRISYPATGTATVLGCSTDNFAIRPASLADVTVADADAQTAGTARALNNTASSGGVVHKAGQPFSVRATARNALGALTSNYNGTPLASVSACGGTACAGSPGSLAMNAAAVGGIVADDAATYSEVGSFRLQLSDAGFASVDAGDGSTDAEMTVQSSAADVGRFVPDRFAVTLLVTPVLRTFDGSCTSRSFTYVGQPFGYATRPQAVVTALAADGDVTVNYAGALWKLTGAAVQQAYAVSGAPATLDVAGVGAPTLTASGNGSGVAVGAAADLLRFARSASTPVAPFDPVIGLSWRVTDASEAATTGNGSITTPDALMISPIAFDAGGTFRYGVLKLASAYGSELNNLPIAVQAQVWNGSAFVTHDADHCTTLASTAVAMDNYQRQLAACETAIAPVSLKLASGRGFFTLTRPGAGNHGSADLALQLGASGSGQACTPSGPVAATGANLSWLQGRWRAAANYDTNPSARASFGPYKSPLIYLRETF
jgi:MSHA biogenesis protein MshQ